VMVIGAAGGVGVHVLQVAKACGARVIAVDLGAEKLAFARQWGADDVVDSASQDIAQAARALTNGRGVDVVVDVVATGPTMEASIAALGAGGRLAMVGFRPRASFGVPWEFNVDAMRLTQGEVEILGSRYTSHAEIGDTLKLVQQGKIKPVISRTFSLDDIGQAHDALKLGQSLGRLAVIV
jgi:D-arabinose 1-dehydrogenase-like Zn-dependent alcohol dehydrogenase